MYRLTEYGSMLLDRRRVDAYTRALSSVITSSSVVLDLGAGIGTFGIIAAKLGAARVYSVDSAEVIGVARQIAEANGVASHMHFIQAQARTLELPEKVDVIVSDLAGALPLFEEHIPWVIHARDRFLAPGGVMIPAGDRLLCAPLSSDELYASIVEPWRSVPGVDLTAAETMALNAAHALPVKPAHVAAEPRAWATLDYATIASPHVRGSAEWPMETATVIHGIALWFETAMGGGVTKSSGPWSAGSVHATLVLPLLAPMRVDARDTLRVAIEATLAGDQYILTWQAATSREPGTRQSTFYSVPLGTTALHERQSGASGLSDRVLARRVGDEMLLVDLASGAYHVLNDTGARIWDLLVRGEDVEAIARTLASEYDVDVRQAGRDVAEIAEQLRGALLVSGRS
jgi:ubiquinone/menaquinone biosynthesis C-methylase UbiE